MQDTKKEPKSKPKLTTINFSHMKELKQMYILPNTPDWEEFLTLSVNYLCENFPSVLDDGLSKEMFAQAYEQQLLQRIQEGGRILLVWKLADEPVGFANAWFEENGPEKKQEQVHENEGEKTLQIAEFSVLEKFRRNGLGKLFVQKLIEIGQQNMATRTMAEVDEGLVANLFWQRVMTNITKDVKERRILYWRYCQAE